MVRRLAYAELWITALTVASLSITFAAVTRVGVLGDLLLHSDPLSVGERWAWFAGTATVLVTTLFLYIYVKRFEHQSYVDDNGVALVSTLLVTSTVQTLFGFLRVVGAVSSAEMLAVVGAVGIPVLVAYVFGAFTFFPWRPVDRVPKKAE